MVAAAPATPALAVSAHTQPAPTVSPSVGETDVSALTLMGALLPNETIIKAG